MVTFAIALLIMVTSFRRSRLGVSGPMGESMFVDLRDRISKQGNLPALPREWLVESVVKSAGGTSFAGDFVVARRSSDDRFELVVVDVSGQGRRGRVALAVPLRRVQRDRLGAAGRPVPAGRQRLPDRAGLG